MKEPDVPDDKPKPTATQRAYAKWLLTATWVPFGDLDDAEGVNRSLVELLGDTPHPQTERACRAVRGAELLAEAAEVVDGKAPADGWPGQRALTAWKALK